MSSSSDSLPVKYETSSTSTRRTYAQVVSNSSAASKPSLPSESDENATSASEGSQENSSPQSPEPATRKYTRRLIPRKYIPMDDYDENFNKEEWRKRLYGEDVRIVDSVDEDVPEGWILVEGNFLPHSSVKLTSRSQPSSGERDRETTMESIRRFGSKLGCEY